MLVGPVSLPGSDGWRLALVLGVARQRPGDYCCLKAWNNKGLNFNPCRFKFVARQNLSSFLLIHVRARTVTFNVEIFDVSKEGFYKKIYEDVSVL